MASGVMAIEDLLHPLLRRYIAAPRWVKASVGRAYACLPQRVRLGGAYDAYRRVIAATREPAPAQAHALAKLEETLAWAIDTVPAYAGQRHLLREMRDPREALERLPIVDKMDIKRAPGRYLSGAMPRSAALETCTGGSTTTPMRFWLEKHVSRPREHAFLADFRARVGAGEGELTLALRGRTVRGGLWAHEPIQRQLLVSCDHLEPRHLPAIVEALVRHRPAFIEAFPSALFALASWLERHPRRAFTDHVRGVMLFSENTYGFQLDLFRRVFGCPVLSHYGHSERVVMAASMPADDRYFFWPQYGWLELVDERGRRVTGPAQLGHVVATSFDNRVMPFLRYRTGDLAMLGPAGELQVAGCPVVERIEGRLQEFVVCRDGRMVSIATLGTAHFPELSGIDAIQYRQERPGELTLRVAAACPIESRTLRRIAGAVESKMQGGCRVTVAQVPRIERTARGKARMLVQHLPVRPFADEAVAA